MNINLTALYLGFCYHFNETKGKQKKRHTRNLWSLRNKLSGISLLQSIGEIADKISVSLRFFGDDGRGNLNIFVF